MDMIILEYFKNPRNKVTSTAKILNINRNALRNYLAAMTNKDVKNSRNSISFKMKVEIQKAFYNKFEKSKVSISAKNENQIQEKVIILHEFFIGLFIFISILEN